MNNYIKHDIDKSPKTGEWRYMRPEVLADKCIGCGTCVKFCPEACINLEARNVKHETDNTKGDSYKLQTLSCVGIDFDWCKGCGVCANVCPQKAILMKKE